MCRKINLSHISFTDDTGLFTDCIPNSYKYFGVSADVVCMSGLYINIVKFMVFAACPEKLFLEDEA